MHSEIGLKFISLLLTDSASCLSDALILSGFRGGGSGGSDAAAIVTVPAVPFNCIPTRRSKEFTVSSLMAVWKITKGFS